MKLPTMHLRSKSTATTYSFGVDDGFGWALCSVNDQTGELNIISDWDNWAYRWDTRHLGDPSLTHFIAGRSPGSCSYLADKLTSGERHKREVFSPEETVKRLRQDILTRRREFYRCTAELARGAWDALTEILTHDVDDPGDFLDRFYEEMSQEAVDEFGGDLTEHLVYVPTGAYLVLLHSILPALVAACDATVAGREAVLDEAYAPEASS